MIAAAVAPLLALSLLLAPTPTVATTPQSAPTGQMEDTCSVEDATLTWGVKESFRSYISGTIANGEWTVADGATYETPEFTFHGGTGTYGADNTIAFAGAIRFTGHGGILDTTVANPVIEWSDGTGTLYLDVSGTTQEGEPVDERAVPFATLAFDGGFVSGRALRLGQVTATLSDPGAAAFGTYEPGEPLDPLRLDLIVGADCTLLDAVAPVPTWPSWIAAIAGVAIIGVVAVFVVRRRRGRPSTIPD